jgi:hypothetical protein
MYEEEEPVEPPAMYDIEIDDESLIRESGFLKFSLPLLNGKNKEGKGKMKLYHEDRAKIIYCDFYIHDYDKTIKAFKDKLQSALRDGDIEDQKIVDDLVTYFENACKILRQDKDSGFFNGNGNHNHNKDNDNDVDVNNELLLAVDRKVASSSENKVTAEDIHFIIETMKKEAPYDIVSIKQLFFGMASAFTKCPIHHSVNSRKTGSGKTHDLTLVSSYFPKKYVVALAGMSDKALFHRHGVNVIVDENTGNTIPVQPIIDDLESKIEELEEMKGNNNTKKKNNKKEIQKYKAEIQDLYDKSQKQIELDNKIFLFLDTAQEGLFNTLMSMISQDSDDQLYEFTDKSGAGKIGSKVNRLRGTPTIFNTQVIDDSRQVRYQEKNRRLIHVIPDTSTEKIHTAMGLIGQRYGLVNEEYDIQVVNSADKERAKEIVSILIDKLIDHSKLLGSKESGVKISFTDSIAHGIHKGRDIGEWGMTVMDRTMRYLSIITKVNMDSRPRIIDTKTGKFYPISTFEDLKETLELMAMASSMLRPYIANWYNTVFLPSFKELPDEPNKVTKDTIDSRDGNERTITVMQETEIGLTSKELAQKTHEIMKIPISADSVRKQYLYPLSNMGVINSTKGVINRSENLYSPVEDSIFSLFDDSDGGNQFRLKILDCRIYPTRNLLEEDYRTIVKHDAKEGVKNSDFQRYKIVDTDGTTEITVDQLIDKYLSDPETCFIRGYPEFNNNDEAPADKKEEADFFS